MIIKGQTYEDSPTTLRGRVKDQNGNYPTQATTSAISVTVWDMDTGQQIGDEIDIDPEDAISDTLISWDQDSTGYNLTLELPGSCFPEGGRVVRVEPRITPTTGPAYPAGLWELQVIEVMGQ